MRTIKISAGEISVLATLEDNETADAIWEALPITVSGSRWGGEIYFGVPVQLPQAEDARDLMESGELGYWAPGTAFCIFWGSTPASRGDEIRAASPVNPFGRIQGDPTVFDTVRSGSEINLARSE